MFTHYSPSVRFRIFVCMYMLCMQVAQPRQRRQLRLGMILAVACTMMLLTTIVTYQTALSVFLCPAAGTAGRRKGIVSSFKSLPVEAQSIICLLVISAPCGIVCFGAIIEKVFLLMSPSLTIVRRRCDT